MRGAAEYHTMMLSSLDFALGPSFEIIVVGNPSSGKTQDMLGEIVREFLPNKVVLLKSTKASNGTLERLAPFTKNFFAIDDKPTAYVCTNYSCKLPTTDIGVMRKQLGLE